VGYRSENSVIYKNTTTYPIYASSTVSSVMVLEGFRVLNSAGTYLYLDGVVNFPSSGVINTTFITYECSLVYYVKYSVLLFDATESDIRSQIVFQLGYASLTVDSSIASSFFSNILPRYQSSSRMFFGMSSFNFTKTVSKEFDIDTTNYASIYSTYNYNNISNLRLTYYFFAERSCSGGDYFYNSWADPTLDDCLATCSSKTDRPTNDNTHHQCVACHYSCLTCSSNSASNCLTCNSSNFRHMVSPSPTTCNCMTNYVSSGGAMCNLCSAYMTGCLTCSSTSTCSSCIPGYTGSSSCTCSTGSIVSGYCNTVYGCITISDINGTQTCTTCNSTLLVELNSIFKCACITGTTTLSDQSCDPICGDNYVLAVEGCDDGNLINGDGCSSSCTVETNWSCVGVLTQGSTCKINVTVSLNYIGSFRDTNANRAYIYFKLTPYFKEYLKVNFSQTISTSLSY
jgi:cysteine-rich repeat protein